MGNVTGAIVPYSRVESNLGILIFSHLSLHSSSSSSTKDGHTHDTNTDSLNPQGRSAEEKKKEREGNSKSLWRRRRAQIKQLTRKGKTGKHHCNDARRPNSPREGIPQVTPERTNRPTDQTPAFPYVSPLHPALIPRRVSIPIALPLDDGWPSRPRTCRSSSGSSTPRKRPPQELHRVPCVVAVGL